MVKLKQKKRKASQEPDEFLSVTQRLWLHVSESPRRTAALAGVIVGVLLILTLVAYFREKAKEERLVAVAAAVEQYLAADEEGRNVDTLRQEFEMLSQKHAGSTPGGQALFFLACLLTETEEYSAAEAAYRQVQKDYAKNATLAIAATNGLANVFDLMGRPDDALELYRGLLEKDDVAVPRGHIHLEMGRIYEEQGKPAEAAATYRALTGSSPEGPWSEKARKRLDVLEGSRPTSS